jgi:hypothetical protein
MGADKVFYEESLTLEKLEERLGIYSRYDSDGRRVPR